MKRILCICFGFILALGCLTLIGCGKEDYSISANLDKFTANIQDATGLGVASINGSPKLVKSKEKQNKSKTASFVKTFAEEDEESEFDYEEVQYKDQTGKPFSNAGLEVYRLYTTKDYTFISYISANIRKKLKAKKNVISETPFQVVQYYYATDAEYIYDITKSNLYNFNETFYNTKYEHSYIIHNKTGLMFDTAQFANHFTIKNNMMNNSSLQMQGLSTYVYFELTEENELKVKKFFYNDDIKIFDAFCDADGYYYVLNDFSDENNTEEKVRYIKMTKEEYDRYDSPKFKFSNDNMLYKTYYYYSTRIKTYKNGEEIDVPYDTNATFKLGGYNELAFIKDGYAYTGSGNVLMSESIRSCPIENINSDENNKWKLTSLSENMMHYDKILDLTFGFDENDNLYYYKNFDFISETYSEKIKLLENCQLVKSINYGYLVDINYIFQKITSTQTLLYTLEKDENGNANLNEISNKNYDNINVIISLKPIN